MTWEGNGRSDLDKVLDQFPREFTIDDVMAFFEWPNAKARTAIVNGQQSDAIRISREHRTLKGNAVAVYENVRWRQVWLKRAWGTSDVRDMDSTRSEHL
jgi:hypothetical protein